MRSLAALANWSKVLIFASGASGPKKQKRETCEGSERATEFSKKRVSEEILNFLDVGMPGYDSK